jgi:multiple sugar transport system substrate-binding protein
VTEEAYQMSIEVSTYHGKFEFYEFVPGFPMGEIMGNIISGGMKVEEAVELYKEQAQDAVDQLYINKD